MQQNTDTNNIYEKVKPYVKYESDINILDKYEQYENMLGIIKIDNLPNNIKLEISLDSGNTYEELNEVNAINIPLFTKIFYRYVNKNENTLINNNEEHFIISGDFITYIGSIFKHKTIDRDINLPNSMKILHDEAFAYTTINKQLTIPNSITTLGSATFYRTTFNANFTLPNSITMLGTNTFEETTFNAKFTLLSSITTLGDSTFYSATFTKDFTLPNSITMLGDSTFFSAKFKDNFTLPSSITTLGNRTFYMTTFNANFTLPSSITTLGTETFREATFQTKFTIPNTLKATISYNCFAYAKLPLNNQWLDENSAEIADQNHPQPGNYTGVPK